MISLFMAPILTRFFTLEDHGVIVLIQIAITACLAAWYLGLSLADRVVIIKQIKAYLGSHAAQPNLD